MSTTATRTPAPTASPASVGTPAGRIPWLVAGAVATAAGALAAALTGHPLPAVVLAVASASCVALALRSRATSGAPVTGAQSSRATSTKDVTSRPAAGARPEPAAPDNRPVEEPIDAEATRGAYWRLAQGRHELVVEEWTAILRNPVSLLDHVALLDGDNAATAAFMASFEAASRFAAEHGTAVPAGDSSDEADEADRLVARYSALAKELESAWEAAHLRARRTRWHSLPLADQDAVAEAAHLFTVATDRLGSEQDRAAALTEAVALLDGVSSVDLPEQTRAEITDLQRVLGVPTVSESSAA